MRLIDPPPLPLRVDALAAQLPADAWRVVTVKEGSKGPLRVQVVCRRVVAIRDGMPGPDLWLVLRRGLDPTSELKTYLSNAPADTAQATLVWLLGRRWPIEVAIRESKDDLGMDHYEVRGWRGWHHHLTMTFLAHHFLVWQRLALGGKSTGPDRASGAAAPRRHPAAAPTGPRRRPPLGPLSPAPELRRSLRPSPPPPAPRLFLAT